MSSPTTTSPPPPRPLRPRSTASADEKIPDHSRTPTNREDDELETTLKIGSKAAFWDN